MADTLPPELAAIHPRGHYYAAPTTIKDVPGLAVKHGEWRSDFYSGNAEAVISAGVLSAVLLPGQPGRNVTSQAYRPAGGKRLDGECWDDVPGYLRVTRQASGRFQVHLTVSRAEQSRRKAARDATDAERKPAWPPLLVTQEERLRCASTFLKVIVDSVGFEQVQCLLEPLRPRRSRPCASYLQLVVSAAS